MTQLDAAEVLDWATAGVGATALAKRWNSPSAGRHQRAAPSPRCLTTRRCWRRWSKIEDFRNLAQTAEQVVTSSKLLKKAKREQRRQPDNGAEEGAVRDRQAAQGDPREAPEAPGEDPGVHVRHQTSARRRSRTSSSVSTPPYSSGSPA